MLLSGKSWLCLWQILSRIQILAEVHRKRTDRLIADLQFGVVSTISPHSIFREQITACTVHVTICGNILCGLSILLSQVFYRTGCRSVLLISGTGIFIECHNSGVKIHLGDIDCCGVILCDNIFFLVI